MPTSIIDGEKLHYHDHRGALQPKAPPLVLVHGAGGNLMHWPGELRRLPDHEVFALDLPGHGRSGGPGRTEIGAYTEIVREFADALKLPAFVLGGHSMGGAIALEFALRYGGRLAGLILVGTGARLRVAPEILRGIEDDFAGTTALLAEWAHGEHVDPNLQRIYLRRLREVDPQVLSGDFVACDAFDRRADVAAITVPALILCGAADRMTPARYSQFLATQMPDARLIILPGAGHMAMLEPLSRSALVAAIMQFAETLA
jgi:pimeloyl-ACP methyl ester carboxylesterase